jgi:hypothetical protein
MGGVGKVRKSGDQNEDLSASGSLSLSLSLTRSKLVPHPQLMAPHDKEALKPRHGRGRAASRLDA